MKWEIEDCNPTPSGSACEIRVATAARPWLRPKHRRAAHATLHLKPLFASTPFRSPPEAFYVRGFWASTARLFAIARPGAAAPAGLIVLLNILFVVLFASPTLRADDSPTVVKHRVLLVAYEHGESRFMQVGADGKLEWEHKLPDLVVMFQPLANGNIVYAHGGTPTGVSEINRDHKVIWNYVSKATQVLSCERLANGNTLVGEQGPCQAVEVNAKGEVVSTITLTSASVPHNQLRRLHKLDNGHILAAHEGDGVVREVDADGKVVWEYKGLENVFEAVRLKNGNTLIGCGTQKRVIEVTPAGKTVWELKADDVPTLNLQWITSLQVLPNGNYVIANFLRGHEGQGAHAFEITREKKIVWQFADHQMLKSLTMLQVIDP